MRLAMPNSFRAGRLNPHILPVLVWLLAVAAVVGLFRYRSERFQVVGIAQSEIAQVCAPTDGRIAALYVKLFDTVEKDQTVAAFDDRLIKAQIATVSAEIEHLMSQLVPLQEQIVTDQTDRDRDRTAQMRRFAVDVENARLEILNLKAQIASDRVTLADLEVEVEITQKLLAEQAIAPYEHQKAKALHDALAEKIKETQHAIEQAQEHLQLAQQRREEFFAELPQQPSVESALEPIRKQIAVQERLIDELTVQLKDLTVKAPIDGVVIPIQLNANQAPLNRPGEGLLHEAGEVVLAGQPILTIAQPQPKHIVAYAREDEVGRINIGARVQLIKGTEPAQIAEATVSFVGPVVEQMPARLWQNPNMPQWGRPFLVEVPAAMKLTPGELVGIKRL